MSSDAFMHACTHLKVHAEMGVGERFMQRWGWGKGSCRDGGGGKVHAEMGVGEMCMQVSCEHHQYFRKHRCRIL